MRTFLTKTDCTIENLVRQKMYSQCSKCTSFCQLCLNSCLHRIEHVRFSEQRYKIRADRQDCINEMTLVRDDNLINMQNSAPRSYLEYNSLINGRSENKADCQMGNASVISSAVERIICIYKRRSLRSGVYFLVSARNRMYSRIYLNFDISLNMKY